MDAAQVASLAKACEATTDAEMICWCSGGRITEQLVIELCSFAETQAHCSEVRRDVFSILVHCLRSPGFAATLGARANTLLCDALGCGERAHMVHLLDELPLYAALGTRDALEVIGGLIPSAKFKLLKQLSGTRWAEVIVGFIRYFEARAPGAAAMRALAEFVKLPAFPDCANDVDPDDRCLLHLRSTAVSELLRANAPSVLHRMVQHSHCALVSDNVANVGNAEWQAPLALRGLYSLASSTNVQADVTKALGVELRLQPSLFTNLVALLDVATSRVTKSTAFLALSMCMEEMTANDLHEVVLASKLPSLLVREIQTKDGPQPFSKIIAYAHSAMTCLYFLMNHHREEATRTCAEQGGVAAVLDRLTFTIEGAEEERARRNDNKPVDPDWNDALKNNFVHTILFAIVFLTKAAIVDKKFCDQVLDADVIKLFWRLEALFDGSSFQAKIRTWINETTAALKILGQGKYEQKLLDYKSESNVRKQQERAAKSAALEQVRRDAGVEVALRDRPEEHCCPISYEVMVDPVIAADGHAYERVQIERWLQDKKTSPLTNAPLATEVLYPVHALKSMIDNWEQEEHNRQLKLCGKRPRDEGMASLDAAAHAPAPALKLKQPKTRAAPPAPPPAAAEQPSFKLRIPRPPDDEGAGPSGH